MPPKKDGHPIENVWFLVGALVLLVALWYVNGGPGRADIRGIFLKPPPPLDTGASYGPGGNNFGEAQDYQAPTSTNFQ